MIAALPRRLAGWRQAGSARSVSAGHGRAGAFQRVLPRKCLCDAYLLSSFSLDVYY